ncbi:aminotransferase class V-fold PLP-dependent enzyme [Alkalicella caledoniensis]|uniref:cysteine desulfurase n=1 Tax=Alkalicella caledoniensis TaxID=2731377 RepID=A0A7G9W8J8_ALKCA|nr:aminotransferase class V-fold PLP-dependent enzyme [Alkalicella caledoniensis]QNO15010.1 aminotransferase class V-fold PLP-dependent enzyme [Alkalicella caledoniensis]
MIYLDNGATSYPKPEEVYKAHDYAFRKFGANPGRGGHTLARECARVIYKTREKMAEFINAKDSREISFTSNTTEALNQMLLGVIKEGDHVITSQLEHNSVWRPLEWLKENKRIKIDLCKHDEEGFIDIEDMERKINKNTKLIIINHCSNVFGCIQDIEQIGNLAKRKGVYLAVDGAQSLGYEKIDVQNMNIDMLAFAGHKGLLGPFGVGGMYVKKDVLLEPIKTGGTGSISESPDMPEQGPDRYESGTMNTPGIYSLGASLDYISEKGVDNIKKHKMKLVDKLIKEIGGYVTIYGPKELEKRGPVVSFNIDDKYSSDVAFILDTVYGIAVRAGLHCSPLAHKCFNTLEQGTVRVTPGLFNTEGEIDTLITAIKEIKGEI